MSKLGHGFQPASYNVWRQRVSIKQISPLVIVPESCRSIHACGAHTTSAFRNFAIKRKSQSTLALQAFVWLNDFIFTQNILGCRFDYCCLTSKSLRLMCQALLTISSFIILHHFSLYFLIRLLQKIFDMKWSFCHALFTLKKIQFRTWLLFAGLWL